MADNIIKLNKDEDSEAVKQARALLQTQVSQHTISIDAATNELKLLQNQSIQADIDLANETDKKKKQELTQLQRESKALIKKQKLAIENYEELLSRAKTDLGKLNSATGKEQRAKDSVNSIDGVFVKNNIHYVINGQKWWMVDPDGDRRSPRVVAFTGTEMKDILFLDADWKSNNEQEIKDVAKEKGRMFKHIVRDFNTAHRPGTYNQMIDIRSFWLKPVYDVEPHPAFRLLCLSIAGGDEDYADQLERMVAYRYIHPEDVMIPNIDSCATGGTGRDTFFGIIRNVFTEECCATISEETFSGTHNGDLFGKMWVKVSEKDSRSIPIDKIKDLTGDRIYRHRAMGENATDAVRLFNFMFFRNGYTTTAKLAGTGPSGEDRRFEPIIARYNLARHIAKYTGMIDDFKAAFTLEQETAATMMIKQWQKDAYQCEDRISEWLGYIIKKHDVSDMTELLPLHGAYYEEMKVRQQRGIEVFMPKFITLMDGSNVINIKAAHKLYDISESSKTTKDWFKNAAVHWLNTKADWDCIVETESVYPDAQAHESTRRRFAIIRDSNTVKKDDVKYVFDITDFIDADIEIDGKINVDNKITLDTIRTDLL
jgi:hypothetical protein